MGRRARQQQRRKRTKENVTDAQQPKEVALAPNVPAESATNKNVTEQNNNQGEEEVVTDATQTKKDKTESQGASESQKHGNDEGVVPVDPIVAADPVVSTLAQHSWGGTKAHTEKTRRGPEEKEEQEEESASLNFIGTLDKAKLRASRKCRWLIINLQSSSHMLNPNIWESELLSSLIKSNLIFWQDVYETEEGRNACMEYNLPSKLLPAVLLINPFTGQEVIRSCKVDEQTLLQDILPLFLDKFLQPPQGTSTPVCKEDKTSEDEVLTVVTPLVGESVGDDMGKLEEDNEPINIKLGYPSLPEEPPELPEGPHICKVEIRLPNGRRIRRNFWHTDPIKLLWSFSYPEVKDGDKRVFHFVHIGPGKCRHLVFESDLTFKDAQIADSTLNFLWD